MTFQMDTIFDNWIIIGGIVGVILLLGFLLFRKKGGERNTLLLVGIPNAGKTVLFVRLRDGLFRGTQTSMKQNDDTFVIHSSLQSKPHKPIHVVDLPGHQRLRSLLKDFLPLARGIVFVVDSVDFEQQIRSIAEYLFDIFTNKIVKQKKLPILIVCNKSDILNTNNKTLIQTELETEIDELCSTRKSIPDLHADETETFSLPRSDNGHFSIQLLENNVSFVECSVKAGNVSEIVNFINKYFL